VAHVGTTRGLNAAGKGPADTAPSGGMYVAGVCAPTHLCDEEYLPAIPTINPAYPPAVDALARSWSGVDCWLCRGLGKIPDGLNAAGLERYLREYGVGGRSA
jgi:hypothetical protein